MRERRVYRIVRMPDGRLVKELVNFKGTSKLQRRMIQDADTKLWLYKTKYQYEDERNSDKS